MVIQQFISLDRHTHSADIATIVVVAILPSCITPGCNITVPWLDIAIVVVSLPTCNRAIDVTTWFSQDQHQYKFMSPRIHSMFLCLFCWLMMVSMHNTMRLAVAGSLKRYTLQCNRFSSHSHCSCNSIWSLHHGYTNRKVTMKNGPDMSLTKPQCYTSWWLILFMFL